MLNKFGPKTDLCRTPFMSVEQEPNNFASKELFFSLQIYNFLLKSDLVSSKDELYQLILN